MNLRKLEVFVAVVEQKSFSGAAKTLPMAQSAVSIAIQKLEESLGCLLLERKGRSIKATPDGESIYRQAKTLLTLVDTLKSSVSDNQTQLTGKLSLACPAMLAAYFLPDLLDRFLKLYPELTADIAQAGSKRIEAMLLNDEIEVGVVNADNIDPALSTAPFIKEEMVACVARNHPFSKLRHIRPSQFVGAPMALYESGYFLRTALQRLCTQAGVKPDIRLQTNFLPLIIRTVEQGFVSTVGLRIVAQQEPNLIAIPLRPKVAVNMAIAWRTGRPLSKASQAFIDWVAVDKKTFKY